MQRIVLAVSILSCVLTSACASARIERASQFARAGIVFTESLPAVYDESLEAKVRASSAALAGARKACPPAVDGCREVLRQGLEEDAALLTERVELLRAFRRHAGVLRTYFQTLGSLAASEAPAEVGASAGRLVERAQDLRAEITGRGPGIELGDVPERVTGLVVARFQSAALKRALDETAEAMAAELALQRAVLAALADQTRADRELLLARQDEATISRPFLSEGSLPPDWPERRLAALRRTLDTGSLDAAERAANGLESSFHALVENRLDAQSFAALMRDLNELVALAEAVEKLPSHTRGLREQGDMP